MPAPNRHLAVRRSLRALLVVVAAVWSAACGGDSSGSGPAPTLSLSGYSGALSFIGATVQLSASTGSGTVGGVQWSSSDGGVAVVSASGLVTAVGPGTATVSAQASGASGSVSVAVAPAPATLLPQAGASQSGAVGNALGSVVVVEVRDQGGTPVAGATVAFQPSDGGAAAPASATTDAQGRAQTAWTLGTVTGIQTLQATSGGQSTTFQATAQPGPPVELLAQVGNGQVGLAGRPLPEPIRAQVADQFGNGVAGVTVSFGTTAGNGTLSATSAVSDAQGLAAVVWTLGRYAGENSATAQTSSLAPTTFMATVLPNGMISGIATSVNAWTAAPPASVSRSVANLKLPQSFATYTQVGSRAATFDLPGRDLLVGLAKPRHPSFLQAATSTATADAQTSTMRTVAQALPGRDDFRVTGVSPVLRTLRIEVDAGVDSRDLVRRLEADARVEWVEENGTAHLFGGPERAPLPASTEPLYPWQAWHYESIELERAWKLTTGSPNVVVAVVDDGTRFDHPDLAGALLPDGFDFVQDGGIPVCGGGQIGNSGDGDGPDPDPTVPILYEMDQAGSCVQSIGGTGGHGLHVAGTIAARDNTGGLVGIAPGVRILPVRVLGPHGSGSWYDIAQGILYAAGLPADGGNFGTVQLPYRAHVINLSLGGPTPNNTQRAAIQAATNAGSLVIASAGNVGTASPNYPASYPEAMSVSSVGPNWTRPNYSSFGSTVEIAAPGGAVVDNGGDPNFGVWSSTWDFDNGQPHWEGWQGTSMAAPHVAGVAALLFSQDPSRSASQVRALLTDYSRDLGPQGWDQDYGFGLLDALGSLTQGGGIPGQTWVQLHDASTGLPVANLPAQPGGGFSFSGLPDGDYFLYGGLDEFGDGFYGLSPQPWSSYGGASNPTPITVDGAGDQTRSFVFGRPFESEPNQNTFGADVVMVGAYIEGLLDGGSDLDFFRIIVPEAGTYRFETYGIFGTCGFAIVPDTVLDLLDGSGVPVASGDDIDGAASNFCSRIVASLQPGVYYLRVSSFGNAGNGGLYGLWTTRVQ